jgi:predicted permease
MGPLLKDLKFGARALLKRPGSTVLSVIAFALGIGLTTTMFSIIYGVYFRGIGVPEANRLTVIHRTNLSEDIERMGVDQHDFYDWREQQESFVGLAAFYNGTINVSGTEGPERFDGAFVSANLFDLLMVAPVIGTTFREGDDAPGAPLTAVIGYDVWQTRHNGDPGVVGTTAKVNGEQATILGVMPDGFMFPQEEEIWVPLRDARSQNPERGDGTWSSVMGRLKDGVTFDQAMQDMTLIAQRLAQEYPESNEGVGVGFIDFVEQAIGDEADPVFVAMQIATIFVLLIACANVANLLLARAALRTKEAAVRSAIGASRLRVAFPFFSEAVVLSGAGALLGMGIAKVGTDMFDRAVVGIGKPYFMQFDMDLPILGYVVAVTALTALVSGGAPAWQIARADVNSILKDENRGSSSMRAGKVSKLLVIGQVAMSCALLVGAGLMTKSITKLRNYEFNFETENLFTARIGLFESDYPTPEDRQRVFHDLKQQLQAIPRAQSVTLADALPTWGMGSPRFAILGETYETDQDYPRARRAAITPDYFQTFSVNITRGRDFTVQDVSGAPDVALVNQRFAEKFFPGADPIGRQIREGTSDSEEPWLTITGVVPNMKMEGFQSPPEDSAGFYVPLLQADRRFVSIAVQVAGGNAMALTSEVRNAVRAVDPDLPIYWVRDMSEVIHQQTWFYKVFGTLFIVFGVAALFLASVGLYGVLAFSVSRRVQEMGIRMALGANARDVLRLIVREGGIQLAVGLTLGLGLALGVSNVVQLVMYDVEPRDPTVFGTIVLVISLVSLLASLVPARRATRVDPMVALRYE